MSKPLPQHPQNLRYPSVLLRVYVDTHEERWTIARHLKILTAERGMSISAMLKAMLQDFLNTNPINERKPV